MSLHRIAVLASLWLIACGGGGGGSQNSDDASEERLLPTQQIELVLQMKDAPASLRRALADFASDNGVELRVEGEPQQRAALVELKAAEFAEWLHGDRLAALPAALTELARSSRASASVEWEGELRGLPWRVRPIGLLLAGRVDPPADWPALQSFQHSRGAWGADESSLVPSLLALATTGHAAADAASTLSLRNESWSEALSFLTRSIPLDQFCGADELERRFVSGAIAIMPSDPGRLHRLRQLQPERALTLAPFPPLELEMGDARVPLEARILVLPRGGAYPELAAELARELHSRAAELIGAPSSGFFPANPSSTVEDADADEWVELFEHGFARAPFPGKLAWEAALAHAIRQSIDRKRNPEQALADAEAEFERGRQ